MADAPFDVVGLDALSPHLARVRFPATKEDVLAAVGDIDVPMSRDSTVPLHEILDAVAPPRFASGSDLERAIQRVSERLQPHEGRARGDRGQDHDRNVGSPRPPQTGGGGQPRKRTRKINEQDARAGRGG